MSFELENITAVILHEINVARLNQAEVAKTCAIAIRQQDADWHKINAAIVERWSSSARERVLTMAWKIVEAA
jgi:hypothetical protein